MVILQGTVTLPATRQVASSLVGSNHNQTVHQFEQDINLMSSNLFDKFMYCQKRQTCILSVPVNLKSFVSSIFRKIEGFVYRTTINDREQTISIQQSWGICHNDNHFRKTLHQAKMI